MAAGISNGYICNFVPETNTLVITHHKLNGNTYDSRHAYVFGQDRLNIPLPEGLETLEATAQKVKAIFENPETPVTNLVIEWQQYLFADAGYDLDLNEKADVRGKLLDTLLTSGEFTDVKFCEDRFLNFTRNIPKREERLLKNKAENNRKLHTGLFTLLFNTLKLDELQMDELE